ncbi:hypothetical protein LCGC14_1820160 [marine sediment metagenome]|uniref:Uncharacterized protein n=1 Tax=marine sediment metagenome TaxID=412755 RepID=A0A0F9JIS3_9ZZZZ
MTEFQGWLLLAMLAAIVAEISHHGDCTYDARLFGILSLGFVLIGFVQLAFGL